MSIFTSVPAPRIKRSRHNLSFPNNFSANFGRVYPVLARKVVPGDRFHLQSQSFVQFQSLATKVFQAFVCRQAFFYVPARILWENFEDFYSVNETENYIHPFFNYQQIVRDGQATHGSLFDYFNLPTFQYPKNYTFVANYQQFMAMDWVDYDNAIRVWNICNHPDVSIYKYDALKIIAFKKIFADWYADENLQESLADWKSIYKEIQQKIIDNNGDLTKYIEDFAIAWKAGDYNKSYPKDYFTGCLPFAQKGPQVNLPFTGNGRVNFWREQNTPISNTALYTTITNPQTQNPDNPSEVKVALTAPSQGAPVNANVTFQNGLTSLEDLRSAIMLQQFYERNARSGTRYKETILAHFGILTPDARLDRSQLIQDTSTPVTLGSVYSTSANVDGKGITGEPVSTGVGAGYSKRRKFRITEHGYIISLWVCYPLAAYYKGVEREWMELDKFDYFWPDFQHLGEQEVKVAELSLGNGRHEVDFELFDGDTFGYNPRYSQYKVALPQIHGDFRGSRKAVTAARDFPIGQALSDKFIQVNPTLNNLDRVFNYMEDDYDHLDVSINFIIDSRRPMSYFGVPRFFNF